MQPIQDAFRQRSDEYLAAAGNALLSPSSQTSNAIQAGYFALLVAFHQDELAGFTDHPNPSVAAAGAGRLELSAQDAAFGQLVAGDYYAYDRDERIAPAQCLAWAHRVRARVGWS